MKILILVLFFASTVFADEFYLKNPPPYRYLGNDQGNVGSCQAEADVTALENIFWNKGYSVQLSTFYRHAFNWQDDAERAKNLDGSLNLRIDAEDKQILNQYGSVVPYFMLPDNRNGYDPSATGLQPHIKDILVKDPNYKAFTITTADYSFIPGYSNSVTIDQLKSFIKEGRALSLSISGSFLMGNNFDNRTGLMRKGVDILQFAKNETSHSVAIVGFDDSLYADYGLSRPGAVIIKNSWENMDRRGKSLADQDEDSSVQAALNSMKYKVSPNTNLPGYFAVPYELIVRSTESPDGMFIRQYTMDFDGFAAQYEQLKDQYKVITAPFICGSYTQDDFPTFKNRGLKTVMLFGNTLLELLRSSLPEDEKKIKTNILMAILNLQTFERQSFFQTIKIPQFSFAMFSQNKSLNVDRVKDFYVGKYNDYYCFPGADEKTNAGRFLYPNESHYEKVIIQKSLEDLSANRYGIVNWWNFLRELFVMEVNHEVPKTIPVLN